MIQKVVDRVLSVGTTSVVALPANPARRYALLVNDSANIIYLMLGSVAVANRGIRLNSGGGSYEINLTNPFSGEINVIADAASSAFTCLEVSY